MRLITIILLSTFAFSDCDDVYACNYGQDEECIFPPIDECCDNFIVSNLSNLNETICIPEEFGYNQSNLFASYIFINININNISIENNDWVGAFNGNICVGARQWNVDECNAQICDINVMGDNGSVYSEGYMQSGQIPTFKIYDVSEGTYYNTESIEPEECLGGSGNITNCVFSQFSFHIIDELNAVLEYQAGDLNGDSFINVNDIVLLVELVLSISAGNEQTDEQLQLGDIYPDGQLNVVDIVALVSIILE